MTPLRCPDIDSADKRPTDEELMGRFRESGDEAVYNEITKRYETLLRRYFRQRGQRAADADDLIQEVFICIFRFRERYEPGKPFNAWIFSIATHKMHNAHEHRCRKRRYRKLVSDPHCDPNRFDPEDDSRLDFDHTEIEKVRALLQELPEAERRAIEAVFFQGMSWRDASSHLQMAHGTFCTVLSRGIQRLRERFKRITAAV